jgi:hypothetical protein
MFLNIRVFWHFRSYRSVNSYHRFEESEYLIQGQKTKYNSRVGEANPLDVTRIPEGKSCLPPSSYSVSHSFNLSKPSDYIDNTNKTQILRSAHTVYLHVSCGSQNKQRLFACTVLTDWLL